MHICFLCEKASYPVLKSFKKAGCERLPSEHPCLSPGVGHPGVARCSIRGDFSQTGATESTPLNGFFPLGTRVGRGAQREPATTGSHCVRFHVGLCLAREGASSYPTAPEVANPPGNCDVIPATARVIVSAAVGWQGGAVRASGRSCRAKPLSGGQAPVPAPGTKEGGGSRHPDGPASPTPGP